MTREERIEKLQHLITCMKCEVSGKPCDDNCPTQYDAGNMGEIIENLEEIAKALEQEPCGKDINVPATDAISRQQLERELHAQMAVDAITKEVALDMLEHLPSATPTEKVSSSENPNKWIPVKWHEITDEEREREGYPKEWACHLDSIMPYDGQRILITTKGGYVELDECYSDDGCTFSLDSGYDWIDDVVAWCELPKPYKAESEDKCKKCKYYRNPDYTRCHECKAESENKE